jgi:hypothetical protein
MQYQHNRRGGYFIASPVQAALYITRAHARYVKIVVETIVDEVILEFIKGFPWIDEPDPYIENQVYLRKD